MSWQVLCYMCKSQAYGLSDGSGCEALSNEKNAISAESDQLPKRKLWKNSVGRIFIQRIPNHQAMISGERPTGREISMLRSS